MYDYRCLGCKCEKEELVKTSDEVVNCDGCGGAMLRLFPAPSIKSLTSSVRIKKSLKERSLTDAKTRSDEYIHNARKQMNKYIKR